MFWVRLRSGIILMAIMVTAMILGGYVLFGLLFAVSLIGMYELYKVYGMEKTGAAVISYLTAVAIYACVLVDKADYRILVVLGQVLVLMVWYVIRYPKYDYKQIAIAFIGVFYVAIMISYIYHLRCMEGGAYSVWLIFIGSWGSDTFAYLTGMTLGKHKFAPVLSPKKSIEGCVGGVLGAALIGFIYALIFQSKIPGSFNPLIVYPIVGAACSVISQIGDLAASGIKRQNNIKDYGTLIPGHGGILDRFDSVIYTAPLCYALLHFLG